MGNTLKKDRTGADRGKHTPPDGVARFFLKLRTDDGATIESRGELPDEEGFALYMITTGIMHRTDDSPLQVAARAFRDACKTALDSSKQAKKEKKEKKEQASQRAETRA